MDFDFIASIIQKVDDKRWLSASEQAKLIDLCRFDLIGKYIVYARFYEREEVAFFNSAPDELVMTYFSRWGLCHQTRLALLSSGRRELQKAFVSTRKFGADDEVMFFKMGDDELFMTYIARGVELGYNTVLALFKSNKEELIEAYIIKQKLSVLLQFALLEVGNEKLAQTYDAVWGFKDEAKRIYTIKTLENSWKHSV